MIFPHRREDRASCNGWVNLEFRNDSGFTSVCFLDAPVGSIKDQYIVITWRANQQRINGDWLIDKGFIYSDGRWWEYRILSKTPVVGQQPNAVTGIKRRYSFYNRCFTQHFPVLIKLEQRWWCNNINISGAVNGREFDLTKINSFYQVMLSSNV